MTSQQEESIRAPDFSSFFSTQEQNILDNLLNVGIDLEEPLSPSQQNDLTQSYTTESDIDYLTRLADQLAIDTPTQPIAIPNQKRRGPAARFVAPVESPEEDEEEIEYQERRRRRQQQQPPSQPILLSVYNHTQIMSIGQSILNWVDFGLPTQWLQPRENTQVCPIHVDHHTLQESDDPQGISVSGIIGRGRNGTVYQISQPNNSIPLGWQSDRVPLILKQSNRGVSVPIIPEFLYYKENEGLNDITRFTQSMRIGNTRNISEMLTQFPSLILANPIGISGCFQLAHISQQQQQQQSSFTTLPVSKRGKSTTSNLYETCFPLYVCTIEYETELWVGALASELFTSGKTPHTVLQLRAFTCQGSKRLNIISERLGLDRYPELNSMEFLPQILQSRFHDMYQSDFGGTRSERNAWRQLPHLSLEDFPPDSGVKLTRSNIVFSTDSEFYGRGEISPSSTTYSLNDPYIHHDNRHANRVWQSKNILLLRDDNVENNKFRSHSPFDSMICFKSKRQYQQQQVQYLGGPFYLNGDGGGGGGGGGNSNILLNHPTNTRQDDNDPEGQDEAKQDQILTEEYQTQWNQYNSVMKQNLLSDVGRSRLQQYSTILLIQTLHALSSLQESYEIENLDVRMPNILLKCVGAYNPDLGNVASSPPQYHDMPYFRDHRDISTRTFDYIEYRFNVIKLNTQGEPTVYPASFFVPNIDLFVKISDFGMGAAYRVPVDPKSIQVESNSRNPDTFTVESDVSENLTTQITAFSRSPSFMTLLKRAQHLITLFYDKRQDYYKSVISVMQLGQQQQQQNLGSMGGGVNASQYNYNGFQDVVGFMQDHINQQFPTLSQCERRQLLDLLSDIENFTFILNQYDLQQDNEEQTGIIWHVPDTLANTPSTESECVFKTSSLFNKGYDLDLFLWAFNYSLSEWLYDPIGDIPLEYDQLKQSEETRRGMAYTDRYNDKKLEQMQVNNFGLPSLWLMNRLQLYRNEGSRLRPHLDDISTCGPLEALNMLYKLATTPPSDERVRNSTLNRIAREQLTALIQRPMGVSSDRIMIVECDTFNTINTRAFC